MEKERKLRPDEIDMKEMHRRNQELIARAKPDVRPGVLLFYGGTQKQLDQMNESGKYSQCQTCAAIMLNEDSASHVCKDWLGIHVMKKFNERLQKHADDFIMHLIKKGELKICQP